MKHKVNVGDALLRAVDVGFIETVKKILEYVRNLQVRLVLIKTVIFRCIRLDLSQQSYYSISHLLGTVTTW